MDKVGDFKFIVYVEFHCLRVGVGMAILSGMWELFADKARHLHPLYSTETLKIIGLVWSGTDATTDRAKIKLKLQGKKITEAFV